MCVYYSLIVPTHTHIIIQIYYQQIKKLVKLKNYNHFGTYHHFNKKMLWVIFFQIIQFNIYYCNYSSYVIINVH